jgi:hypothetical protein
MIVIIVLQQKLRGATNQDKIDVGDTGGKEEKENNNMRWRNKDPLLKERVVSILLSYYNSVTLFLLVESLLRPLYLLRTRGPIRQHKKKRGGGMNQLSLKQPYKPSVSPPHDDDKTY